MIVSSSMDLHGRRVLIDGRNLELRQGTGLKTYGLTLIEALTELGASPKVLLSRQGVYGLFGDELADWTRARRSCALFKALVRAPFKVEEQRAMKDIIITRGLSDSDFINHVGLFVLPDAYEIADQLNRLRVPMKLRVSPSVDVWHTTVPSWIDVLDAQKITTIHDLIPQSEMPVEGFYAGGGAALFQTRLLRSFLDATAYAPFYWEDVEWGWRARKSGYRVLFCPESVAHHSRRSTIDRHYEPAEVDFVVQRNRLLFQLRNLLAAGSAERAIEEIARSAGRIAEQFRAPRIFWKIALGRLWNHLARPGSSRPSTATGCSRRRDTLPLRRSPAGW